jgi:hypothetical protein
MQLLTASLAILVAAVYLGLAVGLVRYPSAFSPPWAVGEVDARAWLNHIAPVLFV